MACNIWKANGKLVYRTSIRSLTPDEIRSPTELKSPEAFDAAIEKKYGFPMTDDDFKDDPEYANFVTPTFSYMQMMKSLLPRCRTLKMLRISTMLINMTNMLGTKLGYLLGMRSALGR
jgi:hypothetical protein